MLRSYSDLLLTSLLVTALALAIAAPVMADDDDDNGVACPCWTAAEGRFLVEQALAIKSDNWSCGSEQAVRPDLGLGFAEDRADADFIVEGPDIFGPKLLDLEAVLQVRDGEDILVSACSVEVAGELLALEEDLMPAEAVECVRILGGICLENLPTSDSDGGDDDDDDD